MGQVQHASGWRRARALGVLGVTGAAAAAVVLGLPNTAVSGELDAPCNEAAANCQVGDLAGSVLALGSNGSTIFASDNFSASASGPLTHFCFWGIYNSNVPGTDNIVISFYNDTMATSFSPGYPVGPSLASYSGANLSVTRADSGLDFAGLDVYEYSVTWNGTPFNATAGTCYWIEISNAVTPADAWFILNADNAAGLGDQRAMQRDANVAWPYNSAQVGSDLAICINGGLDLPAASCAIPGACTTGAQDCNATSLDGGCADSECCTIVCTLEPLCCSGAWDELCVDFAINGAACAVAPYNCPGGGPPNDCASNPTPITADSGPVNFDLTNANTDGASINVTCNDGQSPATFDVWYIVEAPADGQLTIDTCATASTTDLVMNIYNVGNGTYDPQDVLDESNFYACDDDGCCPESFGCPSKAVIDVTAGTNYLIRVGTWSNSTPGPGVIEVTYSPEVAIWNTGVTAAVNNNGTPNQLGYSSGNLGGTTPERWMAQPFTLPAVSGGGTAWHITKLSAQGFVPAGATNETLDYIVWSRDGIGQVAGPPVYPGDQLVSGSAAFPVPLGDEHLIDVDFELPPGDYWLTIYAGGNISPPNNFAWFCNAQNGPDGIPNLQTNGQPFMWRSSCVTTTCAPNPQGFQVYTAAGVTVQDGQNPALLYTACFKIIGEPVTGGPSCAQDCVTSSTFAPPPDGVVDAADLAFLLGAWGPGAGCADTVTSSTFAPPPDGVVDAADLAALLGAWGNPGCN